LLNKKNYNAPLAITTSPPPPTSTSQESKNDTKHNNYKDNESEDNKSRRSRLGIAVFSGDTAFHAALVEMASQINIDHMGNVGMEDKDGESGEEDIY